MARKAKRSVTVSGPARHTPVARSAAGSRSLFHWPDLPLSRPPVSPAASVLQRRKRQVLAPAPSRDRKRAAQAVSWGEWHLPPTPSKQTLSGALTCARRGIRREVIFAKRLTGPGAKGWKKHFSNRRCK